MESEGKIFYGGLVLGGFVGVLGGYLLGSVYPNDNLVTKDAKVRSYQLSNKQEVLRVERTGKDFIFVEDENKSNPWKHLSLESYLERIPREEDRTIREIIIKKLVGWYDE